MRYVFDNLRVARGRLRVVRAGRQRRCGRVAQALLAHSLHFAFLRLRELRRNDDQAQVDHEEGANLGGAEASQSDWTDCRSASNAFFYAFLCSLQITTISSTK